jgi:predicted phage terminase large subunit-like protein
MWALCCSDARKVAIAAPRNHAKSTAITHAFVLASVLFRTKRYVLVLSETEDQAKEFLGDIKFELSENLDLMQEFGIRRLVKDSSTDIIVEFTDGSKFRIRAIGAEQRVRGRKWGGTRPDLIVADDLEDDEMVEQDARREKFKNWFFKALVPALSDHGQIRIVGTILHMDSLLMNLLKNETWKSKLYKAHDGFDQFTNILWPEKWPEARLRAERDQNIAAGIPEAYSQEYLNNPIDQADAFFRREDFLPMEAEHFSSNKLYYAAIDFAISDADKADWTVIVVGGMDSYGMLNIEYLLRFRGDGAEIIDNMLAIQARFDIQLWKAEEGAIKKALAGELQRRMLESGTVMNIVPAVPTKDKRTRARAIQARMRAGGVRFNKDSGWYGPFEEELLQFPKGGKKDQVDAIAWLGIAIQELSSAATMDELVDEQYHDFVRSNQASGHNGRSYITGY